MAAIGTIALEFCLHHRDVRVSMKQLIFYWFFVNLSRCISEHQSIGRCWFDYLSRCAFEYQAGRKINLISCFAPISVHQTQHSRNTPRFLRWGVGCWGIILVYERLGCRYFKDGCGVLELWMSGRLNVRCVSIRNVEAILIRRVLNV